MAIRAPDGAKNNALSGAMGSPSAQVVRTSMGARRMREPSVTNFQAMEILWSNLLKSSKCKDPCKNMISIKISNFVNSECKFSGKCGERGGVVRGKR